MPYLHNQHEFLLFPNPPIIEFTKPNWIPRDFRGPRGHKSHNPCRNRTLCDLEPFCWPQYESTKLLLESLLKCSLFTKNSNLFMTIMTM